MSHDPDEGSVRREQLPPDETPEAAAARKAMSQPDPQDTAFIAIGAAAVWATTYPPLERPFNGGFVEFIDAAITFAPLVSAASERHSNAPFSWAYYIATPFGRWVGGALIDAGRPGGVTRAEAALALDGIIQRTFEWDT